MPDKTGITDVAGTAFDWMADHPKESALGCLAAYMWAFQKEPTAALVGCMAGFLMVTTTLANRHKTAAKKSADEEKTNA